MGTCATFSAGMVGRGCYLTYTLWPLLLYDVSTQHVGGVYRVKAFTSSRADARRKLFTCLAEPAGHVANAHASAQCSGSIIQRNLPSRISACGMSLDILACSCSCEDWSAHI